MDRSQPIPCSNENHQEFPASFLHISSQETLICQMCQIENQYNRNRIVILNHCLNNDPNIFIPNWPPGFNASIASKLQNEQKQKITIINQHFDNLVIEQNKILELKRKQALIALTSLQSESVTNIQVYNKVSQRDKLAKILKGQNVHLEIEIFLSEMIRDQDKNLSALNQAVGNTLIVQEPDFNSVQQQLLEQSELLTLNFSKQMSFTFEKIRGSPYPIPTIYFDETLKSVTIQNNKGFCDLVSNFEFQSDKKYIFRVSLSHSFENMNYFSIGLISQKEIETECDGNNFMAFNNQNDFETCQSFCLTKPPPQHCGKLKELEVRICIAENTFTISDYPNYFSINSKNPSNEYQKQIDQLQTWKLQILLGNPLEKQIIVHNMRQVYNFPSMKATNL